MPEVRPGDPHHRRDDPVVRRRRRWERRLTNAVVAFAAALLTAGTATGAVRPEGRLDRLIDHARQEAGLGPLDRGARVSAREERHARRMAEAGRLWHADIPSLLQGIRWRAAGEVVGAAATARDLVRAWLQSPEHRAVLLRPDVRRLGIGAVRRRGFLWVAIVVWT